MGVLNLIISKDLVAFTSVIVAFSPIPSKESANHALLTVILAQINLHAQHACQVIKSSMEHASYPILVLMVSSNTKVSASNPALLEIPTKMDFV